jgi:2-iminoacetate synthase
MSFSNGPMQDALERWGECSMHTHSAPVAITWEEGNRGIAATFWDEEFGKGGALDTEIIQAAVDRRTQMFSGQLFGVVPVYVTSICAERCLYCNFRAGNRGVELERLRLDPDELESEVAYLVAEKGLRVIELVYATDPQIRVDRMCRDIEQVQALLTKYGGGVVGINAEAFEEAEYRQLRNAGLNFAVLWQETYDRDRYAQLHPGNTKKARFDYRIDAFDRMIAAGIDAFGMGVLSGLSDWRLDWALLLEHESYLAREYGCRPAILGVPRLKPAAGAVVTQTATTPSRQEYATLIAAHGLFSPSTLPFINTREDWALCEELAQGGGALFTFNCSTIPGGYARGTTGYQFPTGSYDAPVFSSRLEAEGLHSVFDWSFVGGRPIATKRPATTASGS